MRIGYARVSAQHQNLDRQLATLKAGGCKGIYKEKQSGREGAKRPQLERAINALGSGDVLVLAEWDGRAAARKRG
jgi:DNA invertase Pin-like site-specific DNA recombinase